jgi:hypothetical protein
MPLMPASVANNYRGQFIVDVLATGLNTKIILTIQNTKIILARNVRPNIRRQLIGDNVST